MQCSICQKMFAATLSICPSCGAMQTQHNQAESSLRLLSIEKISTSDLALEIDESAPPEMTSVSTENEFYSNAEEEQQQQIRCGQTTTLLEFPAKKSKDQEWREEIKNRVRQRKENGGSAVTGAGGGAFNPELKKVLKSTAESSLVINLKPKIAEKPKSKDLVAEALKRIERSRQKFENDEFVAAELGRDAALKLSSAAEPKKQIEINNSTLTLVSSRKILPALENDNPTDCEDQTPLVKQERKSVFTVPLNVPTTAPKPKTETFRESTADLSDLEDDAAIAASLKTVRKISAQQALLDYQELADRISPVAETARRESADDYAPLGQRFVAGAIDLILAAAAAATISHLAFGAALTTNWAAAALTFTAILFLYLTAALLFTGTTIGLRLFGMFVVTAEDGDVPAVSQTIIGNAVYLLILATGGIGLLTMFFSSERRALHDLLSGTVVIKE